MWSFLIEHSILTFDFFAILALIVLVAVVVYYIVRMCQLNRKKKELEEKLRQKYADAPSADSAL